MVDDQKYGAIWSLFETTVPSILLSMLTFYKVNNHIKAMRLLWGSRACSSKKYSF